MNKSKYLVLTLILTALILFTFSLAQSQSSVGAVPQRADIQEVYQWRLQDIYATDQLWEQDFRKAEAMLPQFEKYKGKLHQPGKNLETCLVLRDSLMNILDRLYVYANMKRDEDNRISQYQQMSERAGFLQTETDQVLSFIEPEITSLSVAVIDKFKKSQPDLKIYEHYLNDLIRTKAHILPAEQEELLALAGNLARGPSNVFDMLDNADIKYGTIKDEKGKKVELSKARYAKFMESTKRKVRRDAFLTYNSAYHTYYNTLGANYGTSINKDIYFAKARKYNSTLEASLDASNIPASVYQNLIKTINANLEPLHRYAGLRKKILKIDELHPYDLYVPLVPEAKMEFTYEEAKNTVLSGLSPLGQTYLQDLKSGFESGWVDVYETQSKGSGAYCWGSYSTHPYVLMNYNGTLEDVFTIAHEMGHAMNGFYTNRKQPYIYSDHATFVAEVASVTNEVLLMNELFKTTTDPQQRLYLTNYFIEMVRGTFYQQALYAEFEYAAHEKAEKGEALSSESMSQLYKEIVQKYWGPDLVIDSIATIGWARVPHFYTNYYVYQYATSQAAGIALAEKISQGDKEAQKRYLDFLAAGSSDYPIEILKKTGVDMTKPEPVMAVIELFDELVRQMEQLLQ
jgi:oligoendopeptidase F